MDRSDLDFYIADEAEKCTKRFIASFLATYEALTGEQNPEVSRIVKDCLNTAKRLLVTRLTGMEIESKHGSDSELQQGHPENTPS